MMVVILLLILLSLLGLVWVAGRWHREIQSQLSRLEAALTALVLLQRELVEIERRENAMRTLWKTGRGRELLRERLAERLQHPDRGAS